MRREVTDLIGSGLVFAALVTATFAVLAPAPGAGTASASALTAPELAGRDRALFYAKGCVTCHRRAGEPSVLEVGPDLTGLTDRASARRPGMSAEAYVRESIMSPAAFVVSGLDDRTMPDLGLRASDVDALVAFLLHRP